MKAEYQSEVISDAPNFPWLLYAATAPMLFNLYNKFDAPSHPYEAQSVTDIANQAQSGSGLGRMFVVALGLVGCSLLYRYRSRIRFAPFLGSLLMLFLSWCLISGLWSVDASLSLRRLAALVLMSCFFAGCAVRMRPTTNVAFFASIPVIGIVPGVAAEIWYGTFHPFSAGYRFGGTAPHPNVQAAMLSVACILLIWLCFITAGKARLLSVAGSIPCAIFLYLTASRTSLLAVLIALVFSGVFYIVRFHRSFLRPMIAAMILLAASGGLVYLILSAGSLHPGSDDTVQHHYESDATSLNGRLDLWSLLFTYLAQRPLQGYGYGAFWSPERIDAVSADQGWAIEQSHSGYIEEMMDLGVPGAVLYVGTLLTALVACSRRFLQGKSTYGAFAAVLIWIVIHNGTEAIDVGPSFSNTVFYIILFTLALRRPRAASVDSKTGERLAFSASTVPA